MTSQNSSSFDSSQVIFSSVVPPVTGEELDNDTLLITPDGTDNTEPTEMWKFDFETQKWIKSPSLNEDFFRSVIDGTKPNGENDVTTPIYHDQSIHVGSSAGNYDTRTQHIGIVSYRGSGTEQKQLIQTNIDFLSYTMPSIFIQGYGYGNQDTISLQLSFYSYAPSPSTFINAVWTSSGSVSPDSISLANIGGKIAIEIDWGIGKYYYRYGINAYSDGHTSTQKDEWFTGWSIENTGFSGDEEGLTVCTRKYIETKDCLPEYIGTVTTTSQNVTVGAHLSGLAIKESYGITLDSGKYLELKAGVTYNIQGSIGLAPNSTGTVLFRIKDINTGVSLGNTGQVSANNDNVSISDASIVNAYYTPTSNTKVCLELSNVVGGTSSLRAGFSYFNAHALNCIPESSTSASSSGTSVLVDSTEDSTFGFVASDIHNNGTVVGLTDKYLDANFSRVNNVVTYAGTPDKIEINLSLNAEDSGVSNYWARPKMRILRGGSIIAVFDDLVMQQNGSYDGDATLNGYFLDKNPGTNPSYTFEWFDEESRTATLTPNAFSQLGITATNKINVTKFN